MRSQIVKRRGAKSVAASNSFFVCPADLVNHSVGVIVVTYLKHLLGQLGAVAQEPEDGGLGGAAARCQHLLLEQRLLRLLGLYIVSMGDIDAEKIALCRRTHYSCCGTNNERKQIVVHGTKKCFAPMNTAHM